jgi:nitrate reductase assembly molybdenum cofactor insertion protein NarJ
MSNTVTASSNSAPMNVEGLVALYVELRDRVAELKAKLKEETAPYNKGMRDLEQLMLKHLQDVGAESVKTSSGTVYQHVERSATIKDKEAFREFVVANQEFDLLDWRANKTAVFDFMRDKAVEVPGVNTSAVMVVGVRRSNSQEE